MLRRGELEDVMLNIKAFFASIPYEADKDLRAEDYETHFQYTFFIIFKLLSCYTTLIEKHNSHGRADIIIESDNDIYIFEFKVEGTVSECFAQIEDCGYAEPYCADKRKLHKVGAVFSKETHTLADWAET